LANVVPDFRKGKKEDLGNYRLVILISMPYKITGKIILGVLEKHLRGNAVLGYG